MKLLQISESLLINKLREHLRSTGFSNQAFNQDRLYSPTSGHDDNRKVGISIKPKRRTFLGLGKRPGSIRL